MQLVRWCRSFQEELFCVQYQAKIWVHQFFASEARRPDLSTKCVLIGTLEVALALPAPCKHNRVQKCPHCSDSHPVILCNKKWTNHQLNLVTLVCRSACMTFLSHAPAQIFVRYISDIVLRVADIGYRGPLFARTFPNSLSARLHHDVLPNQSLNEVTLGHSVGLFFLLFFWDLFPARWVCVQRKTENSELFWTWAAQRAVASTIISIVRIILSFCNVDDAAKLLTQFSVESCMV